MAQNELTEDEASLYDRQIRLWGLESQKRLRGARILVIGLQGLGCEIAKNIALAGVKSVTLLDDAVVTEEDACSQFLAPRDQLGKNIAEASVERLQALNPMVTVTADSSSVADKPDDFFVTSWHVIVATGLSVHQLLRLDSICRENSVKFYAGDVIGCFGYALADLQSHDYVEEITKTKPVSHISKKAKVEPIKETVKKTALYVPLLDALSVEWSSPAYAKRLPSMEPSYFLMKVLMRFLSENNRRPQPKTRALDIATLKTLRDLELADLQVPLEKVSDSYFSGVFGQLSPVCAIVGGVVAQDVIKTVSQNGAPMNNMFFFNPKNNSGQILSLG